MMSTENTENKESVMEYEWTMINRKGLMVWQYIESGDCLRSPLGTVFKCNCSECKGRFRADITHSKAYSFDFFDTSEEARDFIEYGVKYLDETSVEELQKATSATSVSSGTMPDVEDDAAYQAWWAENTGYDDSNCYD